MLLTSLTAKNLVQTYWLRWIPEVFITPGTYHSLDAKSVTKDHFEKIKASECKQQISEYKFSENKGVISLMDMNTKNTINVPKTMTFEEEYL